MKILPFISIILLIGVAYGQQASKKILLFDVVEIKRVDIPYDSQENFTFNFTNKTGQAVTITNVQTSCGCTTAEKPENPIKKNKRGKISVSYDTKRVGEFVKTITVTSDKAPPVVLTIRGNVLPQKQ
ncbi:MAG: DUF1573 domain-containing protein [Flavobacteriales bacterium]